MVLVLPALAGATTYQDISNAMESVYEGDVKNWIQKNLGQTYQSQRRADLKSEKAKLELLKAV